jgi:hypothetical protein
MPVPKYQPLLLLNTLSLHFCKQSYTVPTPSPLAHCQYNLPIPYTSDATVHFQPYVLRLRLSPPLFNLRPQSAPFLAYFPARSLHTHYHRPDLPDPFSSATPPPQLPVLTRIHHCFCERALYEGPLCVVVVMISVVAVQRVVKMICRLPLLYCHDGYPVSMRLPPTDTATH